MFDIGFSELLLIMVVALVVVGPERLPRLARTAGLWLAKARRFVQSVQEDINREMEAQDLKRTVEKEVDISEIKEFAAETKAAGDELKQALKQDYLVKAVHEPDTDAVAPESEASSPKTAVSPTAPADTQPHAGKE